MWDPTVMWDHVDYFPFVLEPTGFHLAPKQMEYSRRKLLSFSLEVGTKLQFPECMFLNEYATQSDLTNFHILDKDAYVFSVFNQCSKADVHEFKSYFMMIS